MYVKQKIKKMWVPKQQTQTKIWCKKKRTINRKWAKKWPNLLHLELKAKK